MIESTLLSIDLMILSIVLTGKLFLTQSISLQLPIYQVKRVLNRIEVRTFFVIHFYISIFLNISMQNIHNLYLNSIEQDSLIRVTLVT